MSNRSSTMSRTGSPVTARPASRRPGAVSETTSFPGPLGIEGTSPWGIGICQMAVGSAESGALGIGTGLPARESETPSSVVGLDQRINTLV
ncbi:MAG: hypothetical protein Ct9H300mP1_08400 [Planctomycetaceae bacterium]|nr:MAG: hypothetical protein Ct9H300mP1_08400 [Planctomycetaceae bacterium]